MAIHWTIHTKSDGDVELEGDELLMQLLQKSMQKQRPSHEELVKVLLEYLQSQGALAKCNPEQLALIALDVGYFYKVFLEKNNVSVGTTDGKPSTISELTSK